MERKCSEKSLFTIKETLTNTLTPKDERVKNCNNVMKQDVRLFNVEENDGEYQATLKPSSDSNDASAEVYSPEEDPFAIDCGDIQVSNEPICNTGLHVNEVEKGGYLILHLGKLRMQIFIIKQIHYKDFQYIGCFNQMVNYLR